MNEKNQQQNIPPLKISIPSHKDPYQSNHLVLAGTEEYSEVKEMIKNILYALYGDAGKSNMKQYLKPLAGGHESNTFLWETGPEEGIVVKCFTNKSYFMREWSCLKTIQTVEGVLKPLYADHYNNVLFFPYMAGGDLFQHLIDRENNISSNDMVHLMFFLTDTLRQMSPLAHGDIKLENILCNTDFLGNLTHVKLIDVGLCGRRCGTLDYWPPEKHENMPRHYPQKGDIWALGVLFYAMYTREKPYEILATDFGVSYGRCRENFQKYTAVKISENTFETRDGIMFRAEDGFKNEEKQFVLNSWLGLILHGSDWSWEKFLTLRQTRLKMALTIIQNDPFLIFDGFYEIDVKCYRTRVETVLLSCTAWKEFCIRSNALVDDGQKKVHISVIEAVECSVLLLRKMWVADPERRISLADLQLDLERMIKTFYETEEERGARLMHERKTVSSN